MASSSCASCNRNECALIIGDATRGTFGNRCASGDVNLYKEVYSAEKMHPAINRLCLRLDYRITWKLIIHRSINAICVAKYSQMCLHLNI